MPDTARDDRKHGHRRGVRDDRDHAEQDADRKSDAQGMKYSFSARSLN
jgi:hypothetical protein